ncbi:MAG: hypothetical protein RLZZ292_186, partial [Bacteroidota bacterium]
SLLIHCFFALAQEKQSSEPLETGSFYYFVAPQIHQSIF